MPNYLSDMKPDFTPVTVDCGKIEAAFGVTRRPWAESLAETVDRMFGED